MSLFLSHSMEIEKHRAIELSSAQLQPAIVYWHRLFRCFHCCLKAKIRLLNSGKVFGIYKIETVAGINYGANYASLLILPFNYRLLRPFTCPLGTVFPEIYAVPKPIINVSARLEPFFSTDNSAC